MNVNLTICKHLGKKIGFTLFFTYLISFALAQQKIPVSGKVTNGEIPLSNVSVKVAGSKQGTTPMNRATSVFL